jgi:hypothetical protein
MTRYHFSLNNRNNFAFITDNNIDLYTIDLVDLNLFFYQLSKIINIEHKQLIKEIQYQYNKIGLFNNLKRTKSYTIFNMITIIFNQQKYYINLNILPKNINIIDYRNLSAIELNNKLKKISYDIYNLYKVFNNSVIKTFAYKIDADKSITMDNYIIEFEILKKILLEVYKLNYKKKSVIKTVKSVNSIGLNNFILNEIYKPKDGFIQDITIEENINSVNYMCFLKEKLKEYNNNLDKYNLERNISLINQILNILLKHNRIKVKDKPFTIKNIEHLSSTIYIERLLRELFQYKFFDTDGINVIHTHVYDMSTIWEKFLENILRGYENSLTTILNGNKIAKSKKNFLFNKEYELKYDFIISKQSIDNNIIRNDVIDAKYKLPKKNYKNEILYDGNDARQVYIYLQSYNSNTIEKPTGILIYPKIVDINISIYSALSFENLQETNYENFKNNFNNKKIFSDIGLNGYELLFKEINFFKIEYYKK